MPLPADALINVTYRGTLFGQRVMTTTSWRNLSPSGGASDFEQLQNIATFFATGGGLSLLQAYLEATSFDLNVDDVVVQEIYPTRSAMITQTIDEPGLIAQGALVPNVAAVIVRKTELAGRDQLSPLHIPGVPLGTNVVAGSWTDPYRGVLEVLGLASYSEKTVPVTGGSLTLNGVIINAPYDAGLFSRLRTHTVNLRARVMRRRTVGLGI